MPEFDCEMDDKPGFIDCLIKSWPWSKPSKVRLTFFCDNAHIDNRASLKPTRQAQTYLQYDSKYAVDDTNDTCAISDTGTFGVMTAFWQVDLVDKYNVRTVRLTATALGM